MKIDLFGNFGEGQFFLENCVDKIKIMSIMKKHGSFERNENKQTLKNFLKKLKKVVDKVKCLC